MCKCSCFSLFSFAVPWVIGSHFTFNLIVYFDIDLELSSILMSIIEVDFVAYYSCLLLFSIVSPILLFWCCQILHCQSILFGFWSSVIRNSILIFPSFVVTEASPSSLPAYSLRPALCKSDSRCPGSQKCRGKLHMNSATFISP